MNINEYLDEQNEETTKQLKNCSLNFFKMTGFHCAGWGQGKILKKKEQWVTCTRENTKAGDLVRHIRSGTLDEITYIPEVGIVGEDL